MFLKQSKTLSSHSQTEPVFHHKSFAANAEAKIILSHKSDIIYENQTCLAELQQYVSLTNLLPLIVTCPAASWQQIVFGKKQIIPAAVNVLSLYCSIEYGLSLQTGSL